MTLTQENAYDSRFSNNLHLSDKGLWISYVPCIKYFWFYFNSRFAAYWVKAAIKKSSAFKTDPPNVYELCLNEYIFFNMLKNVLDSDPHIMKLRNIIYWYNVCMLISCNHVIMYLVISVVYGWNAVTIIMRFVYTMYLIFK